jgi:cytochrome c-type biogenesis protein CcmF
VTVTILQEFIRGAKVRQGATGTDLFTALVGLVARSRRRYGGYIVHVGIVLMFLGFAGQGFKQEEQMLLKLGQQATVGHFTIRHNALTVTSDEQKQMITGQVSVSEDGKPLGEMLPAKWFFNKHESEPTSEVAIRRGPAEDLYIVLAGYDVQSQTATYAVTINPLVNWIWLGFGVLAFGTGLALLPERAFAFALARVPSEAVTTGVLLLLLLMPTGVRAQPLGVLGAALSVVEGQHVASAQNVPVVPRTALERELQHEIICMCRGCGRQRLAECQCGLAVEMRAELAGLVARGMSRDEVYAYYIKKYGSQEPLASPIDKGFNRLAWLLPYVVGASGAVMVVLVARRWSRHDEGSDVKRAETPDATADAALKAKLDDELRDLD